MSIASNLADVKRSLHGLASTLNLRRKPRNGKGRVGDAILARVAEAISHRSQAKQVGPDGKGWPRLSPWYLAWKIRQGYDGRKNIKTGEMLSYEQVLGETTVTDNVAAMAHGLDEETRMKVAAAEEGASGRPPRPFSGIGKEEEKGLDEIIDAIIDDRITELGG